MNFHKYDFEFIYPGFYFVKFDINLNFTNVIVVIHYIVITISGVIYTKTIRYKKQE
jgi:hypothetical protein